MNISLLLPTAFLLALPLMAQEATKQEAAHPPAVAPDAAKKAQEPPVKFVPGMPMPGSQGQKAPVSRRPGNAWFPVVDQDLGTVVGEEHVTAKYAFKNPTATQVDWRRLEGSCQCSKSIIHLPGRDYEHKTKPRPSLQQVARDAAGKETRTDVEFIPVAAGETGEVEVHMDMTGVVGPRTASLDIISTDPETPQTKLSWVATGAKLLVVSPQEVNLNQMTWNDVREFQATVTSPMYKDFNILRMDEAKGFSVTYEKTMQGDQAVWTIQGKYGPLGEESGSGGSLKFYTDLRGESSFSIRVVAFVQGPLEMKPGGFMPLGRVPKGKGVTKEVIFQPNDGTVLEATSLRLENLSLAPEYLVMSQHKDGSNLVVTLQVKDVTPVGMLKGDLVVQLNHPVVKEKRITFNGWVR